MNNIGLCLISRNNYDFLNECWVKKSGLSDLGYDVLNIDEGSEDNEKEKGEKICKSNGIVSPGIAAVP